MAQVVHSLPGRVRIKMETIKGDQNAATAIQTKLAQIAGVQRVRTSTVSSSVVVEYDPQRLLAADLLSALGAQLVVPTPARPAPEAGSKAAPETDSAAPPTLGGSIDGFFGNLNSQVRGATGGVADLRTLFPVALFVLGVRALIVAGEAAAAPWYTLMWFSFAGYLSLNHRRETAPTAA